MKKKYNEKHLEWLKKFAPINFLNDVVLEFNKEFNDTKNKDSIRHILRHNNINYLKHEKYMKHYSAQEIDWLKENRREDTDLSLLLNQFNEKFNKNVSYDSFINTLSRYKIKFKTLHKYSEKEEKWMIENYNNYIVDGYFKTSRFINDFEKVFNFKVPNTDLKRIYKRLGIDKPRSNYGLEKCPLGFEKKTNYGILVKVSDNYAKEENRWSKGVVKHTFNYRKKSHILYEQYHNIKIDDEKYIVAYLDNDKNNFSKENLYLIEKSAFHSIPPTWHSATNPKLKKCMLLQGELKYTARKLREEMENE